MITCLTLVAGLAAQDAPDPTLLPKLREGWRYERIDFPLEFAPDLEFEGFEELAFAPGMFEPDSETYFTYAFAMRLEGDARLDAEAIDALLTTYFRGLCSAVAGGRGLEVDVSTIDADVRRSEGGFDATCRILDTFTTGAAVDLAFEIDVCPTPDATLFFAAASPRAKDGPAWDALRAIRAEWDAARPLPVLLNHVFVAPDAETYAALRDSPFLREEFAVSEERTTVRRDTSYTGVYFYGSRTYFEFLKPEVAAPKEIGACGIAFGVEQEGASARLAASLEERGVRSFAAPMTRRLEDRDVPWFRALGFEMPVSRLGLFSMEYEPGFLAVWNAPPEGVARTLPSVRRRDVLSRYAVTLGAPQPRLFEDVVGVELALGDAELARFRLVAEALGHVVEAGDPVVVRAPEVRFVARRTEGPARIEALRLRLRREVTREPLELGSARLSFDGTSAVLRF